LRRNAPLLRGLAILGVLLNHANWHALSQFAAGTWQGYPYIILDQVSKMAVAAFVLIAGYFVAYATSGGKRDLSWQIVRARVDNLLWPWLVWSIIFGAGQFLQREPVSLAGLLSTLVVHYYFVPLLIVYYLLAPLFVRWARTSTRAFLIGTALVQLASIGLFYLRIYLPGFPAVLRSWIDIGPIQYARFAFFFAFGLVCGMFPAAVKEKLSRVAGALPWLTVLFYVLSVLEAILAYHVGSAAWPIGNDQTKLSSSLFSASLGLCFAAFPQLKFPLSRAINKVGTYSYGLYLAHYPVLGLLAAIVKRFAPGVAVKGWLLVPILFGLTLVVTVGAMELISRLPNKRIYRYVFG
jgi:peptidoglycan/LPS O-acetylase OafA/YrhL